MTNKAVENVLRYQDFVGTVQYNANDKVFHGKLAFITDLVTFEGSSVTELEDAFIEAVDDYVELCEQVGKKPEKSFAGSFNIRMKPELHRQAAIVSMEKGLSLNQLVIDAVSRYVGRSA